MMDCITAIKEHLDVQYKNKGYSIFTSVASTLEQFIAGTSSGPRVIYISYQSGNPTGYYENHTFQKEAYEEQVKIYLKTNENGVQVANELIIYLDGYSFTDIFGYRIVQIVSCQSLSDDLVNIYEITIKVV